MTIKNRETTRTGCSQLAQTSCQFSAPFFCARHTWHSHLYRNYIQVTPQIVYNLASSYTRDRATSTPSSVGVVAPSVTYVTAGLRKSVHLIWRAGMWVMTAVVV